MGFLFQHPEDQLFQKTHEQMHELLSYKLLLSTFGQDFQKVLSELIPLVRSKAKKTTSLTSDLPETCVIMNIGASEFSKKMINKPTPLIGRVKNNKFILDPRTLLENQDKEVFKLLEEELKLI